MATHVDMRAESVWVHYLYTTDAVMGVSILAMASAVSLVAVLAMLIAIAISSFKTNHMFIRSQLGAYFVSLVLAELMQATGSVMSARWVHLRGVELGPVCSVQAALKNAGNISTALWSMVIAGHTFALIFLRVRVLPWVFYCTLVCTWFIVGFVVILGPTVLQTPSRGPFWGISGYWCWITDEYRLERFTMEYIFMFATAALSTVLYGLIFLRLRGNIEGVGFRITFCRARTAWQCESSLSDPQIARVGKCMLWYPLVYVVLILPIAICRWSEIFGSIVPEDMTIFADSVFVLSGLINAILYSTTRRVVPIRTIIPSRKNSNTSGKGMTSFDSGSAHKPHAFIPAYPAMVYYHSPRHTDLEVGIIEGYSSTRRSMEKREYLSPQIHHAAPRFARAAPTRPPADTRTYAHSMSTRSSTSNGRNWI